MTTLAQGMRADDTDLEDRVDQLLLDVGLDSWLVRARDGVITLTGPGHSLDAVAARMLARTVPGVLAVRTA